MSTFKSPYKIDTAQKLVDELLVLKEKYGTLDVPIHAFIQDEDLVELDELDALFDGEKQDRLHSIQINLITPQAQEGDQA